MLKTPREAADSSDGPAVQNWLNTAKIHEIHEYIRNISVGPYDSRYQQARTMLEIRISDRAEAASVRLERYTWVLVLLTAALVALTVVLIFKA